MKIVRIDGGLGNQMFCYAFALALANAAGEDVLLDSHRYAFFPNHHGYELGRLFNIELKEASSSQLWKVTYPAYNVFMSRLFQRLPRRRSEIIVPYEDAYPDILNENKDGYYIGNWQWYKVFDPIRSKITEAFRFKAPLSHKNAQLYAELSASDSSVSLHIRRGDYLYTPQYCNICTLDYYKRAIAEARQKLGTIDYFAIFSNDSKWCEDNIVPLLGDATVTLVDWNIGEESYNDMRLMSACRCNIIANSSFSWWGAYLNQRADKVVISPDVWINRPLKYRIQCDDWICL